MRSPNSQVRVSLVPLFSKNLKIREYLLTLISFRDDILTSKMILKNLRDTSVYFHFIKLNYVNLSDLCF